VFPVRPVVNWEIIFLDLYSFYSCRRFALRRILNEAFLMAFELEFTEAISYPEKDGGILLYVALSRAEFRASAEAVVDSGGSVCLFSREPGVALGLDVEAGLPKRLSSLGGPIDCFGREVTLETAGLSFQSIVYFAKYPNLPRNILGRQGWLRNLKLGLGDYENKLYLGKYE
jgi:hypothetical protein